MAIKARLVDSSVAGGFGQLKAADLAGCLWMRFSNPGPSLWILTTNFGPPDMMVTLQVNCYDRSQIRFNTPRPKAIQAMLELDRSHPHGTNWCHPYQLGPPTRSTGN